MQPTTPASTTASSSTPPSSAAPSTRSTASGTKTSAPSTSTLAEEMKTVAQKIGATGYELNAAHPYSDGHATCSLGGSRVQLFSFFVRAHAATVLALAAQSGHAESEMAWSGNVLIVPADPAQLPGIRSAVA